MKTSLAACSLCLGLAAIGCSGGGGGPAAPASLQVSGTWTETSQIVFNPCEFELPSTLTGSFQLSQTGTQLSVIDQGEVVGTGSLNLMTGDFTLSGSGVINGITVTIVQSGRFSSSTRYTAETVITFSDGVIVCTLRTTDVGSR